MKLTCFILFISACMMAGPVNGQNKKTKFPERIIEIDYIK